MIREQMWHIPAVHWPTAQAQSPEHESSHGATSTSASASAAGQQSEQEAAEWPPQLTATPSQILLT